jgi:heptosyltransferase-1
MRVLIVKLSSFGDVIHTFPAVTDLKAARPEIEADWLVEEAYAPLVRHHPGVSLVHPVSLRRLRWPPGRWPALIRHRRALRADLRARRYDLILDAQGLLKSALLGRLAGAPIIGFDRKSIREPAAARLYERQLGLGGHPHIVEQLRRFFAEAIGYPVPPGRGRAGLVRPQERPAMDLPDRYGLIVHGAAWPTKLWPEERWRSLMQRLGTMGRALVLPWGDVEERRRAGRLADGIAGAMPLSRKLAGDEVAGLVAGADFAVGLDTGFMHLAAAFGVPGVTLFGPTDAGYAIPYGPHQRAVSSHHRDAPCQQVRCAREPHGQCCMREVDAVEVLAAVEAMLTESVERPGA